MHPRAGAGAPVTQTATQHTVVIATRPSIRAVGVSRLSLDRQASSVVQVTEVWSSDDGLADGRSWISRAAFGSAYVEAGEALWTTVLFEVDPLAERLVGWRVVLQVVAGRGFHKRSTWTWDDRVFLPAPRPLG